MDLVVNEGYLLVERLDHSRPRALLSPVIFSVHISLLVTELRLVLFPVVGQRVTVCEQVLQRDECLVGHLVRHGLVGEAEGILRDAAGIHPVILPPGDAEGVLNPCRILHPQEQPHLVAGTDQRIDVSSRELSAHQQVVIGHAALFLDSLHAFFDGRHGVLDFLLTDGMRAFLQADVQLFLADVDAHLIILHSFAFSFVDFGTVGLRLQTLSVRNAYSYPGLVANGSRAVQKR